MLSDWFAPAVLLLLLGVGGFLFEKVIEHCPAPIQRFIDNLPMNWVELDNPAEN